MDEVFISSTQRVPFTNAAGPNDYTVPVEFYRGGEVFTPLEMVDKPSCISAVVGKAPTNTKARFIQQVGFSCLLSLISSHGSLMDAARYMTAAAVFDETSGSYFCTLLPGNDTSSRSNIATETGMKLSLKVVAGDFDSSYSVESERVGVPFVPAFSVSHASVTLTQSEKVAKVVVMGTPEQLRQLKVSNCADALCEVVEQDEWCASMRLYASTYVFVLCTSCTMRLYECMMCKFMSV